jgi:hypothetical protein
MSLAVERFDARSWPEGEPELLFEGGFPAYITADQAWTGMALPATGDYVIPGLSILRLDTGEDLGTYAEPNVWVRHQ